MVTINRRKEDKPIMGRPKVYSDKIAKRICREMIKGRSVAKICKDADMPSEPTVYSWLQKGSANYQENFFKWYNDARIIRAERLAEEIIDIADDGTNDTYESYNKKTGALETIVDNDVIRRSELRVKARQWWVSKILSHKYGDKSQLEVTGAGGRPLAPEKIIIDFGDGNEAELAKE